jgi:hypothetical protein
MHTYRVDFHYKRVVTAYLAAERERDIDAFLMERPGFNPIEDCPEIIESDETSFDEESEQGDYDVVQVGEGGMAAYVITPGLQLREIE